MFTFLYEETLRMKWRDCSPAGDRCEAHKLDLTYKHRGNVYVCVGILYIHTVKLSINIQSHTYLEENPLSEHQICHLNLIRLKLKI